MFTNRPGQEPRRALMIVSDILIDADVRIADGSDSLLSWRSGTNTERSEDPTGSTEQRKRQHSGQHSGRQAFWTAFWREHDIRSVWKPNGLSLPFRLPRRLAGAYVGKMFEAFE